MSVPKKHHYLPQFFMRRWVNSEGKVTEYRRPRDALEAKLKYPTQTGFMTDLYADETKTDPLEKQALELVFMQQVDDRAAEALAYFDNHRSKPTDPRLRNGWTRFLMSLMHRSPERVKYLTEKVREYENTELNPDLRNKYNDLRGKEDPEQFEDWLEKNGPITPELRVRLLKSLIDSKPIGETLNAMRWSIYDLPNPRFGFLSGDHPIMVSNGLGHQNGFIALAISPSQLFIAAHRQEIINSFLTQRANALEQAFNDACVRQSHHVIIAHNNKQRDFVDRRFLKCAAPVSSYGLTTWNAPLVDL